MNITNKKYVLVVSSPYLTNIVIFKNTTTYFYMLVVSTLQY